MRHLLQRFAREERGAVVVFLAVSVFTLIIAVGIAVDMSRAQLVRSRLISAIDAATLSAGAVSSSQTANIEAIVTNYFNANMPNNYMGVAVPTLQITVTDSNGVALDVGNLQAGDDAATIRVQAEGTVETTFMRLVGIDTVPISTEAEVERFSGVGPTLEIALVVDNSCSMGGADVPPCNVDTSRIDALRSSVTTLLNTLYAGEQNPSNIRVALVPFNQHVNQESGTSLPSAAIQAEGGGLRSSANLPLPDNGIWYGDVAGGAKALHDAGRYDEIALYCYNNVEILPNQYPQSSVTQYCPTGYEVDSKVCQQYNNNGDYYSCQPGAARSALREMRSFGSSLNELLSDVTALNPTSATNTAIGTRYGLWALDPARNAQFNHNSPPADFSDNSVIKNLVILTDGTNMVCAGGTAKTDAMNADCAATLALRNQQQIDRCVEANNAGINVFTVTFELDDSTPENVAQKQIFRDCASRPEYYFDADDGTELSAAFLAITDALTQQSLRLTR